MKQYHFLPQYTFAGHCTANGSNKIWAACLALEQPGPVEPGTEINVLLLCVYGRFGGLLRVEAPVMLPYKQAQLLFQKKCREKTGKGYQPIAFAEVVPT